MKKNILILLIALSAPLMAQYYDKAVLQKSFEESDWFFTPNFVNPYGLDDFETAAPGLMDDPLINLQINPAFLAMDSLTYQVYLNFRNARQIKEDRNWYYPIYSHLSSSSYYPARHAPSHKELAPFATAAWLFKPAARWTVAVTYQALFQDEEYYDVPYDIYKTHPGYDYLGSAVTNAVQYEIDDVYRGDDKMNVTGHFLTLASAIALTPRLQAGFRLNRSLFDRDGEKGNTSNWQDPYSHNSSSRNTSSVERQQDYAHWDLSAGLRFSLSSKMTFGASAGWLTGDARQSMDNASYSIYEYGLIGQGNNWSYYYSDGASRRRWTQDGRLVYGGLDVTCKLNEKQTLIFFWRGESETTDLTQSAAIRDTSYGNYHYSGDDWNYSSESQSRLRDHRTGSGQRKSWSHTFSGSMRWQTGPKTRIGFGLRLNMARRKIETIEDITSDRFSNYEWINDTDEERSDRKTSEKKEHIWNLKRDITRVQIPVMITHEISRWLSLRLGINRSISRVELSDVTLALYDYRLWEYNEETDYRTQFGERYTEPEETDTDGTTSLLLGVEVNPSRQMTIRLLAAPQLNSNNHDSDLKQYQWWIDFYFNL